jgi:hypothetical protein
MTMRTTILLGAAAAIVATGYLAAAVPSIAEPKQNPVVDNHLQFPLDMPLVKKTKAKPKPGGVKAFNAGFGHGTDEQRAALDQIVDVLGQGYNSLLREQTGDCVDGIVNGASPSSFATDYHLSLIKSADQLKEEMTAEASASASMMGWSATATAKYSADHSSDASTEFLLVKVKAVASPNVTLHTPKANMLPKDDSPAARGEFFKQCGDQYIKAADMGGAFVALFKYQSENDEDRKAFEATFSASGPSVSVDASYTQKMQAFKSRMQLAGDYNRVGGEGVPADTSIDAVMKYAFEYQKTLTGKNMVLIGYETEDYSKIRVAAGDFHEQRKKVDALRDALIKRRNLATYLGGVQQRLLPFAIGDVHADMRKKLDGEIAQAEDYKVRCGNSPIGDCNIPANLLTFTLHESSFEPVIRDLSALGDSVNLVTNDAGRRLKITGRVCWDFAFHCFVDGVSGDGGVYVEVTVNGAKSRYKGPMTLPDPAPGSVLNIGVRVNDSYYADNSGLFRVVFY